MPVTNSVVFFRSSRRRPFAFPEGPSSCLDDDAATAPSSQKDRQCQVHFATSLTMPKRPLETCVHFARSDIVRRLGYDYQIMCQLNRHQAAHCLCKFNGETVVRRAKSLRISHNESSACLLGAQSWTSMRSRPF